MRRDLLADVDRALAIIDHGGTPAEVAFAKEMAAKFGWHHIDWAFPPGSPTGLEPVIE